MKTMSKSLSILVCLVVVLAASTLVGRAQNGITAYGVLTDHPGAGNTFDYTLTISNSASSLNPIGSVWYAWIPGEFFLPTQPSSEGAPANWTASPVTFGNSSLQLVAQTSGARIVPGSTQSFTFVSTDTPTVLATNSPTYPGTPIGASYAYANGIESDLGDAFVVVSVVPEPSSSALMTAGFLGLLFMGWRKRRAFSGPF